MKRKPPVTAGTRPTLSIVPAAPDNLEQLLALIEDYQRFYRATDIDPARNRAFFASLLEAPEEGIQHLALVDEHPVGFSTLYFTRCSVEARRIATLYDLFVASTHRGQGIGRQLMEHAAGIARARGLTLMEWETAGDNLTAQRLYDGTGAERSAWVHYSKRIDHF
ncbi:MAG: GNAT family N-acetyltransferase [Gammaproteobacteria bacterium]|jgi:ribosomal protein S18 acetylase RimI-like enzyme